MVKIKIYQFPYLDAVVIGAELGAKIYGAELMPRPRHARSHVNDTQKMTLDLGAPRRQLLWLLWRRDV